MLLFPALKLWLMPADSLCLRVRDDGMFTFHLRHILDRCYEAVLWLCSISPFLLLRLPSHFSYSLFSKLQIPLFQPERLGSSVQFQLSYCGSAPPPPAHLLTLLDGMLVPSATGSWVSWCLLALAGVAPSLGMLPFFSPLSESIWSPLPPPFS